MLILGEAVSIEMVTFSVWCNSRLNYDFDVRFSVSLYETENQYEGSSPVQKEVHCIKLPTTKNITALPPFLFSWPGPPTTKPKIRLIMIGRDFVSECDHYHEGEEN